MYIPKRLFAVLAVGVLIAVPTAVLAATDTGISAQSFQMFYSANGKGQEKAKTKKNGWTPIPGLQSEYGTFENGLATVSAELKKGRAKVRIVNIDGEVLTQPKNVRFNEGANSFTFPLTQNTSCSEDNGVEWKQVGKKAAVIGGSSYSIQAANGCP